MKKPILTMMLTAMMLTAAAQNQKGIIEQKESSITFVVDKGLPVPNTDQWKYADKGETLKKTLLQSHYASPVIVATSFSDQERFRYLGEDGFYQTLVKAYAGHHPLVLSPDMIWLKISQGFAGYVKAHSEELRQMLVSHEGMMDLVVEGSCSLFSEKADWPALLDGFGNEVAKHTKGDIAQTLIADFSTTGPTERIASQVTLMKTMENYFRYVARVIACGIPSITLQGTPEDWRQVLNKTRRLEQYGLKSWTDQLVPVLEQFVKAAEGHPKRSFWQDIVRKVRVDELRGGACSPDKPTELDGWFLVFFPDQDGKIRKSIKYSEHMPAELVHVGFKYIEVHPEAGDSITTPMELTAGFVGADVDSVTLTLTPKIGWLVSVVDREKLVKDLETRLGVGSHYLVVDKVPAVLSVMKTIKYLSLVFTDKVELPEWMDRINIESLRVEGRMTREEQEALQRRFPKGRFMSREIPELKNRK